MKRFTRHLGLFLYVTLAALPLLMWLDAELFNHAFAASAGGVFDKGEEKGNEIAELLKGKIAVTITGLAVGVCAILMQMGRLSHMVGIRIMAGAFIVSACMDIAAFLYA